MKYLAHIDGDREQSVKEHLQGTAELAENLLQNSGKRTGDIVVGCYMTLEIFRGISKKIKKSGYLGGSFHCRGEGLRKFRWLLLASDLLHSRASCRVAGSGTRGIAVLFAGET